MKLFVLFSILAFYSTYVICVPVPVEFKIEAKNPDKAHSAFITAVQAETNNLLTKMLDVINNPKKSTTYELILEHSFGWGWEEQVPIIKTHIEKMKASILTIGTISGTPPSSSESEVQRLAQWQPRTQDIKLFDAFYTLGSGQQGVQMSALVMIHELSHAAFGSVDKFSKDFQPLQGKGNPLAVYTGYLNKNFREIRNKAGAKALVMNADSYMLMAHLRVNRGTPLFNGMVPVNSFIIKSTDKRAKSPSPVPEGKVIAELKKG